jgi:hypothetical protein
MILSPFLAGNEEQTNAVLHVLKSRDLVTSIRGPAGSGKTTMMQEAVRAVAALSGKDVFVVAPSSSGVEIEAARVCNFRHFSKADG